ncbi:MAG TPA: hypothetical protein VGR53_11410 [Nitrososphaerales archaeon]|nr:hypothetical protein [Nitrososphaerales archaeon]
MKFWSEEFFEAVVARLNGDAKLQSVIGGITTSIIAECPERPPPILITVQNAAIAIQEASPSRTAEFNFTASYEEWVKVVRDGLKIQGEVVKGRVKFTGSLPKMLLYLGKVARMEDELLAGMRQLEPEY